MIRSLYLNNRFFIAVGVVIFLCLLGFAVPVAFAVGRVALLVCLVLLAADLLMLYRTKQGIAGDRVLADKLSNGDENPVLLR